MKRLLCALAIALTLGISYADAGSSVGGGGSRGGFSGGSVPSGSRGGFSSSPSVSAPSNRGSFSSAPTATAPRTTTTTTTTTRSYHYSSPYVGGGVMYGGFGMAYPYTNGLLTGMIIGGMMHPHSTVVYTGPGAYSNNALLYPDGRVVNSSGYLIGTYSNGQFTAIENGGMVAQQVPHDAGQQQAQPQQQPVPIVIRDERMSVGDWIAAGLMVTMLLTLLVFMIVVIRR